MRQCSNAYGGAWLPFLTRKLIRAIRRNPFAALLVEGFLLFAVMSFLSMPMAWATDGIEEWNDPGIQSGTEPQGGVHVEQDFSQVKDDVARQTGKSVEEVEDSINQGVEEAKKQKEAEKEKNEQGKDNKDKDQNKDTGKDTAGSSTNTQTNNGMSNGLTSTSGAALDSSMLNARTAISRVNLVVTGLLLPVGIVWASWQIVYIALVCGLLGIDPLDLISAEDEKTPWLAIKRRLVNFATGLALVGGIWLIFELVLFLVANFVGALETNL